MPPRPSPADVFRALGDEHRLTILEFIATADPACCSTGRGVCACDLEGIVGLAQATVSHHMKILVSAGLLTAEKRGKWVYYQLDPDGFKLARQTADRLLALSPGLVEHA